MTGSDASSGGRTSGDGRDGSGSGEQTATKSLGGGAKHSHGGRSSGGGDDASSAGAGVNEVTQQGENSTDMPGSAAAKPADGSGPVSSSSVGGGSGWEDAAQMSNPGGAATKSG
jgi:hypothetical protein